MAVILKSRLQRVVGVGFVVCLALLCTLWIVYGYYPRHSWAVNFQQYEPKILPGTTKITNRTIEVWLERGMNWSSYQKTLGLEMDDPNFYVAETKYRGKVSTKCGSFDSGEKFRCENLETPDHQQYKLITSSDLNYQSIYWRKQDTFIWAHYDYKESNKGYSKQDWDTFIDSFTPIHYSKLPVNIAPPGP